MLYATAVAAFAVCMAQTNGEKFELPTDPLDVAALAALAARAGSPAAPSLLAPPFQSGMVLQADSATLFGTAGANANVSVAVVDGSTGAAVASATATANATGYWTVTLMVGVTTKGTNVTVKSAGAPSVTLSDVLFGSVFLCSGQSNMQFCLGGEGHCAGGAFAANTSVANAHLYPEIRLYSGKWSPSFSAVDPDQRTLRSFSAVCYLTAVEIKKVLAASYGSRPMGLIEAAVGGTIIEMWSPPEVMQACGLPNVSAGSPATCAHQSNSDLYDQLIEPLVPMSISAAFWYQGESNAPCDNNASLPTYKYYSCLLPGMIKAWRGAFGQTIPFFVVQLAAYGGTDADSSDRTSDGVVQLRQDQLSALSLPKTAVAVTIDLGDDGAMPWTPPTSRHGGIHPRNKTEVGRRLALAFAAVVANASVVYQGPTPVRASVTANAAIRVDFDPSTAAGMALVPTQQCATHARLPANTPCCGSGPQGMPFELLFKNGSFEVAPSVVAPDLAPAYATTVLVYTNDAADVVGVRYAAQGYPLCVLSNRQGLTASPFVMNITSVSESDAIPALDSVPVLSL